MEEKALTLLETLVSTVILVLIVSGLLSLFVAGKKHITHSRSRMTAAELSRTFVDSLSNQVNQTEWGSNCLSSGSCNAFNTSLNFSPILYNSSIDTTAVAGTSLRRAIITIKWIEPN